MAGRGLARFRRLPARQFGRSARGPVRHRFGVVRSLARRVAAGLLGSVRVAGGGAGLGKLLAVLRELVVQEAPAPQLLHRLVRVRGFDGLDGFVLQRVGQRRGHPGPRESLLGEAAEHRVASYVADRAEFHPLPLVDDVFGEFVDLHMLVLVVEPLVGGLRQGEIPQNIGVLDRSVSQLGDVVRYRRAPLLENRSGLILGPLNRLCALCHEQVDAGGDVLGRNKPTVQMRVDEGTAEPGFGDGRLDDRSHKELRHEELGVAWHHVRRNGNISLKRVHDTPGQTGPSVVTGFRQVRFVGVGPHCGGRLQHLDPGHGQDEAGCDPGPFDGSALRIFARYAGCHNWCPFDNEVGTTRSFAHGLGCCRNSCTSTAGAPFVQGNDQWGSRVDTHRTSR